MPNTREKLEVIAHLGDHITYKEDVGICYDSALAKVIEDAYMELKNGVTVQQWIPVTERLPEEDGEYITMTNAKGKGNGVLAQKYRTSYARGEKLRRWHWLEKLSPWKTTHWMPLPEPPIETK